MYKILAFDIDGTLVDSNKNVTPATKEAVRKAAKKGCKIVIATGRPVPGITKTAQAIGLDELDGYVLSFNGGIVMSYKDGRTIFENMIPMEYYAEICDIAKECNVNIISYENYNVVTEKKDDKYVDIECKINGIDCKEVKSLKDYLTFPVPKFIMLGDGDYLAEVEKKVQAKIGDKLDVYRSEPFFLEILPKGVNKADSLNKLLSHLNLKREELMAFGDGFNDISMIEFAGMGVAMSNGNDVIKEKADYIAPSNDEDGIAYVLNKFVLD